MYLFIKQHIEATFPEVSCQRGDDKILTHSILEKVAAYIKQADVVIADCSGRNPNVFYELGMAHTLDKPVVLITSDDVQEAPTDVRSFEFIRYTEDERAFAEKLDKALTQVLGNPFDELYQRASVLFDEFKNSKQLALVKVTKDEFMSDAAIRARTSGVPRADEEKAIARLFLPLMVQGPADLEVLGKMTEWIQQRFGQ